MTRDSYDHLKTQCQICKKIVISTNIIIIPSSTGLKSCYNCFTYWMEDFDGEYLKERMIHHWRDKTYKATGD